MTVPPRDPWLALASRTSARIALGRAGVSLPTREVLSFGLAHAQARDAVYARLDRDALRSSLMALGLQTLDADSIARERAMYLRRPDLGRQLDEASRQRLEPVVEPSDVAIMIGDGLSAIAAHSYGPLVVAALLPHLQRLKLRLGPVVLAEGARVALGDVVGGALQARLVVVLIGERPGLSAANSLSAYLTFEPRPGRTDAERNCISNIRSGGLAPDAAAANLAWLMEAALARQTSGVALKDDSLAATIPALPPDIAAGD